MTTGRCLCGAVTFAYRGPENWRGYCHCESCRRATASPVTAYLGVPLQAFAWTGETPKTYHSSPSVTWHFCANCGSRMAYENERFDGEIHLFAATLDDPSAYAPEHHFHYDEHVPWLTIADDLPRHQTTANPI